MYSTGLIFVLYESIHKWMCWDSDFTCFSEEFMQFLILDKYTNMTSASQIALVQTFVP